MRQELRETLFTRQGISEVSIASLTAFGILGAISQTALAIWPQLARHDWLILGSLTASCITAGIVLTWPKLSIAQTYDHPEFTIRVKCGDILNETGNIVIGFTDTFDTDTTNGIVIDPRSVQGQFQAKYYNDVTRLDGELDEFLRHTLIAATESASEKPRGKLRRYPVGTVAVLDNSSSRYYAVAYGYMRNDSRVSCSVDAIWKSLTATWECVRTHGRLDPVAIPVIGSQLARVGSLDRESLIKMIALSFVASTRQEIVSRQLTIVIHPKDRRSVSLINIDRFLKAL